MEQATSNIAIEQTKICTGTIGCGKIKPIFYFYKNKNGKYGRSSACIECVNKYHKQYSMSHKEEMAAKNKQAYQNNREERLEKQKAYSNAHKEEIKEYSANYYKDNKEDVIEKTKKYASDHRKEVAAYKKEWQHNNRDKINKRNAARELVDINFKLSNLLRKRINSVMKGRTKSGSAVRDLGCTIPELLTYFSTLFLLHPPNPKTGGMINWDNFGEWHIDHIIPLAAFDLTDRVQLLIACNYRNLRPL